MDQQNLLEAKRLSLRSFALWKDSETPPERFPDFWNQAVAEVQHTESELDATVEDSFPASDPPNRHGVVTTG